MNCSICGRPGRIWWLATGRERRRVALCPIHGAPLAPLWEAGKPPRQSAHTYDDLWVPEGHPDREESPA